VDPTGLNPAAALAIALSAAGKLGALGLGLGGAYAAATIVDEAITQRDGEESTTARDAIKEIAPTVIDIQGAAPGLGKKSPKNVTPLIVNEAKKQKERESERKKRKNETKNPDEGNNKK
jgi:hypothetical protein